MSVEVLVACVGQDDSLYEEMNLQTNAVFANQHDRYDYNVINKGNNILKIISTADRGVGKNRNIAIMHSSAEILLFADEDMIYKDGYPDKVINAFELQKDADIIIFELNYLNKFISDKRRIKKSKRAYLFNSLRYGAARIAIKRDALLKSNIWFSLLYGGGAPYSCGEDCLFIREALKKGLRIYTNPYVIADVKQNSSSWFDGFTDKYYIDKGVWLANAFPTMKYPLALYYAYKLKGSSDKSINSMLQLMISGIKSFTEEKKFSE